jgi:acyl-CoA synthetase (AMP-forming)/AMP-acid ligase II
MELEDQNPGHGSTITRQLRELAARRPDDTFVVDVSRRRGATPAAVTYAEMVDRADRLASVLAGLGVGAGDAVHLQLESSPDYLVCLFATAGLGAVLVPTSPAATPDDVAYITSHASCRVSVVGVDGYEAVAAAREMNPELARVLTVGGRVDDSIELGEAVRAADGAPAVNLADEGALAAVLYTSGTTGWPKGVMITHRNLVFAGDAVASHVRLTPADRWLVSLPLSHMNALGYSTMSALSAGASIALLDRFEPVEWGEAAQRSGATVGSLFAVHVRRLLDAWPHAIVTSLRTLLFAQHLTGDERDRVRQMIGAEPLQVYGMTETIAPTIADPPYGTPRPDTIGRLTVWADGRVVDRAGRTVPDGMAGELQVAGQPGRSLMAGYWQRPDETALVLRDGWLRTGDLVVRQDDGYFRFLGRSAEVIKPGVDNVSAPEIERVLLEHVSVRDAAVVGVHDEGGDELIVAFVVLNADDDAHPEEIIDWASNRLADYKVPHRVRFVESLPRNAVGKVEKRKLAKRASTKDAGQSAGSAR